RYVTPGYCRRFIPSRGCGSTPSFTWAATSVEGIFALSQSAGRKDGDAMTSPFAETLLDDCNAHPSFNETFELDFEPACAATIPHNIIGTIIEAANRKILMSILGRMNVRALFCRNRRKVHSTFINSFQ